MKKFLASFLTWQRWIADAIRKYKSKHFEDRSQPARFVEYMVGSYQEKKKSNICFEPMLHFNLCNIKNKFESNMNCFALTCFATYTQNSFFI